MTPEKPKILAQKKLSETRGQSSVMEGFTSKIASINKSAAQLGNMIGGFGDVQKLLKELINKTKAPKLPFEIGKLPVKITKKDGEVVEIASDSLEGNEEGAKELMTQLLVELQELQEDFTKLQNNNFNPDTLEGEDITKKQEVSSKMLHVLVELEDQGYLTPELEDLRTELIKFNQGSHSLAAAKIIHSTANFNAI